MSVRGWVKPFIQLVTVKLVINMFVKNLAQPVQMTTVRTGLSITKVVKPAEIMVT